jgi:NTE family protein
VRASGAYPGLLTPVKRDGRWLVDGGIVNPVPVSVCRALGATHVIGVNLNRDLITLNEVRNSKERNGLLNFDNTAIGKLSGKIKQAFNQRFSITSKTKEITPGIMDVISCTINIMQDRITRSRLAGDPADVMFNPRLSHIGFLETDKAKEIIAEGEECVERHRDQLSYLH